MDPTVAVQQEPKLEHPDRLDQTGAGREEEILNRTYLGHQERCVGRVANTVKEIAAAKQNVHVAFEISRQNHSRLIFLLQQVSKSFFYSVSTCIVSAYYTAYYICKYSSLLQKKVAIQ